MNKNIILLNEHNNLLTPHNTDTIHQTQLNAVTEI